MDLRRRSWSRSLVEPGGRVGRIAKALLSSQYALMLEYRAETALWALSGVVPFIMLGLWLQVQHQGGLPGMGVGELSRYFVAAFVVRQLTVAWVVFAFEEDHLQGRLAPYLLQPLHPLWRYLAAHLAEQFTRLPFIIMIAVSVLLLQPSALQGVKPGLTLIGFLTIPLAFAINFLMQSLIASLCFWSERANALERLLYIPYLFLSGLVAPIDAFPPSVARWIQFTPFPWMLAFPAGLISGIVPNPFPGLLAMLGWIAVLLPACLWGWHAGVRRYSGMGV